MKQLPVKKIQIFGLRCSGTNYLEQLILLNTSQVRIVKAIGHKHLWNTRFHQKQLPEDVQIIIIVRNPYDWLRSIYLEPHHCPELLGLSFTDFLNHPWNAYMGKIWNAPLPSRRMQIVKTGKQFEKYDHVIHLRNSKMKILADLHRDLSTCQYVRYETLNEDPNRILKELMKNAGVPLQEEFQDYRLYKNTKRIFKPKKKFGINKQNLNQINQSLDWENEEYFGYNQDQYSFHHDIPWDLWKYRIKHLGYGIIDRIGLF